MPFYFCLPKGNRSSHQDVDYFYHHRNLSQTVNAIDIQLQFCPLSPRNNLPCWKLASTLDNTLNEHNEEGIGRLFDCRCYTSHLLLHPCIPLSNSSLCPSTIAEEAEVAWFYQDLLELTPKKKKKKCPFHHRGLVYKSRKSRDTWSNRQVWPWSTDWSRAKASGVLPREHTGHSKHPLPTAQETTLHMDITRWPITKSDW